MDVSDVLRVVAEIRGMTMTQISEASGVSRQSLYQIFEGAQSPTLKTLRAIAKALDIQPAKVLELAKSE